LRKRIEVLSGSLTLSCLAHAIFVADIEAQLRDTHPTEAGRVIDDIAPRSGSVIRYGVPQSWFDLKDSSVEPERRGRSEQRSTRTSELA
jgi:hypothetical protein